MVGERLRRDSQGRVKAEVRWGDECCQRLSRRGPSWEGWGWGGLAWWERLEWHLLSVPRV